MIYLDHNATTACDAVVLEEMRPWFSEKFHNPSSVYSASGEARRAIEKAREQTASILGCSAGEIIFTSGGTESDNMAILGTALAQKAKGNHIITTKIEHHAVLNTCKFAARHLGCEVTYLSVDKYGMVDPDELKEAITSKTILITVMYANNEIGTIEPIEEIAAIAHEAGVAFHTDAVQAVGKIPLSVKKIGCDFLSLSAHKFYGPKGIGALYVRKGVKWTPLFSGGGQEKGRRPGTENVAGIVGLGKACELAASRMDEDSIKEKKLRDQLEQGIVERVPEVIINGHPEKRLYNTSNICVKYVEGESMLLGLDFEGILASSASACTSGSLEPSHVLLAIGVPVEIAHGSLRFSFGRDNTENDVARTIEVLPTIVERLRKMSPFWDKK
jgi:cysteine desulfurase